MQNMIVLMELTEEASDISLKVGNMCLNRFCIDEDAAFELSGIYTLKRLRMYDYIQRKIVDKFSIKEEFEKHVIDSALQKAREIKTEDLQTHIVYAGSQYFFPEPEGVRSIILQRIKKIKINSVMFTRIYSTRMRLITKEKMENYCKGNEDVKDSVNDDLESFLENLRLGQAPPRFVDTYFLPKLSKEEFKCVERKNPNYMNTFAMGIFANVSEAEMKFSESDSKFVHGVCRRITDTIDVENS